MHARLDANEVALNHHLSEIEADELRNERVAARATELMASHYSHALPDNVMEALAEMDESHWSEIAGFMRSGDTDGLGKYVFRHITKYCADMAGDLAEYAVDREDKYECPRCAGHGCGKCLED